MYSRSLLLRLAILPLLLVLSPFHLGAAEDARVILAARALSGGAFALSATVSPADSTGTVMFYNGAEILGTAKVSNGVAEWSSIVTPPGLSRLTARYLGDARHSRSESPAISYLPQAASHRGFVSAGVVPVAAEPTAFLAKDFDRDGFVDFAYSDSASRSVRVQLKASAAPGIYLPGLHPNTLVSADFNNDGIPDLAALSTSPDRLSILLGKGDGTFLTGTTMETGTMPVAAAVADFNGDGIADVAVLNQKSNTVSIFLGDGTGAFKLSQELAAGTVPAGIVAGDFNGDGLVDLAFISTEGLGVISGTADGQFSNAKIVLAGEATSVFAIDVNSDGITDLAVGTPQGIAVLLGTAAEAGAAFQIRQSATLVAVGGSSAWADFNGDGQPDLLWLGKSGMLTAFLGKLDGTFSEPMDLGPATGTILAAQRWAAEGNLVVIVATPDHLEILTATGTIPADSLTRTLPTASSTSPKPAAVAGGSAVVTSNADSGEGTLRRAITDGAATITFQISSTTITLTSGALVIGDRVSIDATGKAITISGNNNSRIFEIASTAAGSSFTGLTLTNGYAKGGNGGDGQGGGGGAAGMGGAVFSMADNVTFSQVTFTSNKAEGGTGGSLGGIAGFQVSTAGAGGGGGGMAGPGNRPSSPPWITNFALYYLWSDRGGDGGPGGPLGGRGGNGGQVRGVFSAAILGTISSVLFANTVTTLLEPGLANVGLLTLKEAFTTAGVTQVKGIVSRFTGYLTFIPENSWAGDAGFGAGGGGAGATQPIATPGGFGGGGGAAFLPPFDRIGVLGIGGAGGFGGGQGGGDKTDGVGIGGDGYGGALFLYSGSAICDTCVFQNNTARGGGNGSNGFGSTGNIFSTSAGAAVYVYPGARLHYGTLLPTFSGNVSQQDSGIYGAFDPAPSAALTITSPDDDGIGTLRSALRSIRNDGVITFAASMQDKVIKLKAPLSPEVTVLSTIDGGTRNITISGNNTTRMFNITGKGIRLQNLKLISGLAKGGDGGSGNFGGGGGAGLGGAIFVAGTGFGFTNVYITNVEFIGNRAIGGTGGAGSASLGGGGGGGGTELNGTSTTSDYGGGGGIGYAFNTTGSTGGPKTVYNNTDASYAVDALAEQSGLAGVQGGGGGGGASGRIEVNGQAALLGGDGGSGGFGGGGGGAGYEICVNRTIPDPVCLVQAKNAKGGAGGDYGYGGGGAGYIPGASTWGGVGASGEFGAGGGGSALGGAIFLHFASLTITGGSFTGNSVVGGQGANAGLGKGGAIFMTPVYSVIQWVSPATFASNTTSSSVALPTDNSDIFGTTLNGAPATFVLTAATIQSGLALAIAAAPAGSTFTFDPALTNKTVTLPGEILINKNLIFDGELGGASGVILASGTTGYRHFCVQPAVSFTLRNLTLSGGKGLGSCSSGGAGGSVYSSGDLTVVNTTFLNNGGVNFGGAIYSNGGTLALYSSRFAGNTIKTPYFLPAADPGKDIFKEDGASSARPTGSFLDAGTNSFADGGQVWWPTQGIYINSAVPGPANVSGTVWKNPNVPGSTLSPATTVVISTNASGPGSFAEAVVSAPKGSTINIQLPAGSTITPPSELFIGESLTINGGTNGVILSGNASHRLFYVQQGTFKLSNLTLANGYAQGGHGGTSFGAGSGGGAAGMGGALFVNSGAISLTNVAFTNNTARGGNGGVQKANKYSNPDYSRGGSGGGGAGTSGEASGTNPSVAAGGFGGTLYGQAGGAGGQGGLGVSRGGANGLFGAGGGGGGNGSVAGGSGGNGGWGGGAGTTGAGPGTAGVSTTNGSPGEFGGAVSPGLEQGGRGASLGGAIFMRSGSLKLFTVDLSSNTASQDVTTNYPQCDPGLCSSPALPIAKGGALFLSPGVTAMANGQVTFGQPNRAGSNTGSRTDNNDIYGSLSLPSTIYLSDLSGGQSAFLPTPIGTAMAPIRIQVIDQFGAAMPGVTVAASFPTIGAGIAGAPYLETTTDSSGNAILQLTANSIQGSWSISVKVLGSTSSNLQGSLTFTNAQPNTVSQLQIVSGNPQSVATGTSLAPLKVKVLDSASRPIPYATVVFRCCTAAVTAGLNTAGASLTAGTSSFTVTALADGTASLPLTANLFTGSYTATAKDVASRVTATFNLTNTTASIANLSAAAGSPQNAAVNTAFLVPLQAVLTDANQMPVSGQNVVFSIATDGAASATFAGAATSITAVTNVLGIATAPVMTANGVAGSYSVQATAAGQLTYFPVSNIASATKTIAIVSGDAQNALLNAAFPTPLTVIVKDNAGNPLPNTTVSFQSPAKGAGAILSSQTVVTDSNGQASVNIAANGITGPYQVGATVDGAVQSAIFTLGNLTVLPGSITYAYGSGQDAQIAKPYGTNLAVDLKDSFGFPMANTLVIFSAPATGASAVFPNGRSKIGVVTDSNGRAFTPVKAGLGIGRYTGAATYIASGPAIAFELYNTPGDPVSLTLIVGNNQVVPQNTLVPIQPQFRVVDAAGTPLSNINVSLRYPAGFTGLPTDPYLVIPTGSASARSNSSGIATITTPMVTNGRAGTYTMIADDGFGHPATWTLTNLPGAPALIGPTSGNGQSQTVAQAYPLPLQVLVTDANGAPTSGVSVTFTSPATGAGVRFAGGSATASAITGSDGKATSPAFTAQTVSGSFPLTASISAASTTFTLTNLSASAASISAYSGNVQSTQIASAFSTLAARVNDQYGNPVSAATPVVFTAPASGASGLFANGTTTVTVNTVSGIATATTFTANGTLGAYSVSAAVTGFTPTTFALTNTGASVLSLTPMSGSGQSTQTGKPFSTTLVAKVTAAPASASAGVSVLFTLPASGASGTFPGGALSATVASDANGNATSPVITANQITGVFTAAAMANALTATYSLTVVATPPTYLKSTSITLPAAVGQSALIIKTQDTGWTASSDATWLHITNTSGSGSGTIGFTYDVNSTNAPRVANLTVGSKTIPVTQVGASYIQVTPKVALASNFANVASVGIGVDAAGTAYFPSYTSAQTIVSVNAAGLTSTVIGSGLTFVSGVASDATGNLFLSDQSFLRYYDATTHALSNVQRPGLQSVSLDASGELYLFSQYDSQASRSAVYSVTIPSSTGMFSGVDPAGTHYVPNGNQLVKISPTGTILSPLTLPNAQQVLSVAVDGQGNFVYLNDPQITDVPLELKLYNPVSQQTSTLATGFNYAGGIAVDSTGGNFYLVDGQPNSTYTAWKVSNGWIAPGSTSSISGFAAANTLAYSVLPANIAVTATTDVPWITINSASNGVLTYTVTANSGSVRQGHITILNQSIFTINQANSPVSKSTGDNQSTIVSQPFNTILRVVAPSSSVVNFTVVPGPNGASATFSGSAPINVTASPSTGLATAPTLTANLIAGPFTVIATFNGVPLTFNLANTPSIPAKVTVSAGSPQTSPINLAFAAPLQALVKDVFGNIVSGASVTFTAPATGASASFAGTGLATATVLTNSAGIASSPLPSANGTTGTYNVTTTIGSSSATWALTNSAGVPYAVTLQSGNNQSAVIQAQFGASLVAKVTDIAGNAVPGAVVTFSSPGTGAGAVFPAGNTATTNASGIATSNALNANLVAGSYAITATAAGATTSASWSATNLTGPAAILTATTGNNQSAKISQAFGMLSVLVTDAGGNPLAGTVVTMTPPATGASCSFSAGTTAVADSTGTASFSCSANLILGTYTISASVPGLASKLNFTLTNTVGSPAIYSVVSGGGQSAPVKTTYPLPLSILVTDIAGNPVKNTTISYKSYAPGDQGGTKSPALFWLSSVTALGSSRTDSNGIFTTVQPRANGIAGTVQFAVTSTSDIVVTTMVNTPGAAASISSSSGAGQSTKILSSFAAPLVVLVADAYGNPVPGITVTFSAPATGPSAVFPAATAVTDSTGLASSTIPAANGIVGSYAVTATATGVTTPVTFNVTNTVGNPATLTVNSGSPQSVTVGGSFAALRVLVSDVSGNPVPNAAVTFAAPASGASGNFAASAAVTSNASGIASAPAYTANSVAGSYTLTATATGGAGVAQFALTNLPGAAASISVVSGTPQSSAVTTGYPAALAAVVRDASNNPVPGVPVTFTAPASGASATFSGTSTVNTDLAGVATAGAIANVVPGTYQVRAAVAGVSATANFQLTNTLGLPTSIVASVGAGQSALVRTSFSTPLQATITDAGGNPLAGVTVTFTVPLGSAYGTFANSGVAVSNTSGVATAPTLTAGTSAGAFNAIASVSGLASPAAFGLTSTRASSGLAWSAPAAIAYGTPLSATQLNATATVPGTFTYNPAAGTVLLAGAGQTVAVTFTPSDPVTYAETTISRSITVTKANPVITWPAPSAIVLGSALGAGQLNATSNVPGTFKYLPDAGVVLPVGTAQTLTAAFTPSDPANYNSANVTNTITVTAGTVSAPNLVFTKTLTRTSAGISILITLTNNGGTAAQSVVLDSVKVGTVTATPLPAAVGTIAAGASAQVLFNVPDSTGAPGTSSTLTVSGKHAAGTITYSSRITLP